LASRCIPVRWNERWPAGSPPGVRKAAEPTPCIVAGSSAATASLAASYEQLRERVLAGRPDGWRLGHSVLAGKGMVAWIGAWTTLAAPPAAGTYAPDSSTAPKNPSLPTTTSTPSTQTSAGLSCLPYAGQLVAVLAQMALAHA